MEGVSTFILGHEPQVRLAAFAAVLAAMAVWEFAAPRRARPVGRRSRWPLNLGLAAFNTVVLRIAFPTAAVGIAMLAETRGWGLLHALSLPAWLNAVIAVLVLDLALYVQHVTFHKVPLLWRLHRLHHADRDVDMTTGARFHPIEILLSMAYKVAVVAALGAPPVAVVVFEVLLNGMAIFNHGNVAMPAAVDRALRLLIVTPDMHRVHHSVIRTETDSNYGFQLTWWDHLFRTYRAQPAAGHDAMTLGTP